MPLSRLQIACNADKTEEEEKADGYIAHYRQCISGTYRAKGVFAGRIIYEKTVEDFNKMWWSMRFEAANNRWIFEYSSSKIVMGELKFGGIIENFSDEPGEFIVKYNLSNFITFYYRRLQTKRKSYPRRQRLLI